MGEIKSTLDIIMEKTKGLTMSEEEKEAFQKKETEGKVRGFLQRYLDCVIDLERLKAELLGLGESGHVKADTSAEYIVVEGSVDGDLHGVKSVKVRVGEWSCINPELLRHAFNAASDEGAAAGAGLDIEVVSPHCKCTECGSAFEPDGFKLRCEKCGSIRVVLEEGRELEVESIEV